MVVQRNKPLKVWGTGTPGERLEVSFGKFKRSAQVSADSVWQVIFPAQHCNTSPLTIKVKAGPADPSVGRYSHRGCVDLFRTIEYGISYLIQSHNESGEERGCATADPFYQSSSGEQIARGKWSHQQQNKDKRPYLEYMAINDSRVRPSHLALDGVIRRDDPFWQKYYVPNGFRCRCTTTAITEKQAIRKRNNIQ